MLSAIMDHVTDMSGCDAGQAVDSRWSFREHPENIGDYFSMASFENMRLPRSNDSR